MPKCLRFEGMCGVVLATAALLANVAAPAVPFAVPLMLPAPAAAQSAVQSYEGATATGLALRRLGNTARVLHIGAHPDDENTALFAPVALGSGADAAYLSLTRGEGGQNSIGGELGVALGLIRSEELLAARRLDGGEQFFTRVIDYGYSKDADEAFRHWPRDSLLADVVAVIRRYRPDVVASVWSGTDRDGHGQHEASGVIAREAVLAAADPSRFPEQIEAGLRPHSPELYYRSAWFGDDEPDVELNTGVLDPLLGRSYHQVAMASRSRHRSQDQGNYQTPGPRRTAFDRVDPSEPVTVAESRRFGRYQEGAPAREGSLFTGIDSLLSQRAATAAEGASEPIRSELQAAAVSLREYERLVEQARRSLNPLSPWAVLPTLAAAGDRLDRVDRTLDQIAAPAGAAMISGDGASRPRDRETALGINDLRFHLEQEQADLRDALLLAGNIQVDVRSDEERVVPGQTFRLELALWNGSPEPVRMQATPVLPRGWTAELVEPLRDAAVAPGDRAVAVYAVTVPADASPTMPYFLDPHGPTPVDTYPWPEDPMLQGLPFAPSPVRAQFRLSLGGSEPVRVEREAAWVGVDRRSGEYTRPVMVVPAVSVALSPEVAVVPLSGPADAVPLTVRLRSQAPGPVGGTLRLNMPRGWSSEPGAARIRLEPGAERAVDVHVTPPSGLEPGRYEIGAELEADGRSYTTGYQVIDYPHIAPHHLYRPAETTVRALDVRVADVRVGYVAGSGDGVPEALEQLGVEWEALGAAELASGDFARFDVIITGTRAYEVRDDLVTHNQRLLDWVRDGGTLIVQYNKYPALQRDYTPWPVTIDRPHGRVTDETAPVRVLEPDHALLSVPNPIGPADWEGWVQERGLYFWETWDGSLTPLLAMSDPGEEPLEGALLVGPLGQGTYVYSALALFRQLPEGVPGAYRLLANLISLGAQ